MNETDTGASESPAKDALAADESADARADVMAILVIFSAIVLMALHFVSGWTFDLAP